MRPRTRAGAARADGITWTRLSGDLRAALSSTGFAVLLGPRDVDLLILLALGSRGYDAALAEHVAHLFHGALDRHGLGPADAALAIGAPVGHVGHGRAGPAARAPLGRRGDGAAGRPLARRPPARRRRPAARAARHTGARHVRRRAARAAAGRRVPRTRALLETLEAYLAAGGRKAEAARALHLERQSLYLRLRRIEEALGVSLDDEDVVFGLHLAVRARRSAAARAELDGPSGSTPPNATFRPLSGPGTRASMAE